jgi:hypothetical protein
MGTSLTKLGLFFHKLLFIINIDFLPLRETLYADRVKLFAEASKFFAHAVLSSSSSTKRRPQSVSFRGPKMWKSGGVNSGL